MKIQSMTPRLLIPRRSQNSTTSNKTDNFQANTPSFKAVKGLGNNTEELLNQVRQFLEKTNIGESSILNELAELDAKYKEAIEVNSKHLKRYIIERIQKLQNKALEFYYKTKADHLELDIKLEESGRNSRLKVKPIKGFGFERIAGYEEIKGILGREFIAKIKQERAGEEVDIPGVFAFFGPRGNGKTTSTQAIAQETGCPIEKLRFLSHEHAPIFMENLLKTAEKAESNFKTKGRTILFLDEFSSAVSDESPIRDKMVKFLKDCSKKYHCTFFGATNTISNTSKKFMDLKPVLVAYEPPSKYNTIQVIRHYLQNAEHQNVNFSEVADQILDYAERNGVIFTNSELKVVAENAKSRSKLVLGEDIIEAAKEFIDNDKKLGKNGKMLTPEKLKYYQDDYEKYME